MSKTHVALTVALVASLAAHVVRGDGPAIDASDLRGAPSPRGFLSARIGTVMGHSTLDLRETTVAAGDEAIVTVYVAVGRVTLRVPDGWEVDASALPGIAHVEDTRRPAASPVKDGRPRLVLRGVVLIGTVEIAS